jgi:hypothetical protein
VKTTDMKTTDMKMTDRKSTGFSLVVQRANTVVNIIVPEEAG